MIRNIWIKAALAALLMAGFTMPAHAALLQFNTNFGNGVGAGNGFQDISNFKALDGAFLAANASSLTPGQSFNAYYQGEMSTFGLSAGGNVAVPNVTLTAVLNETFQGFVPTGANQLTASFTVNSGSFALYYNPTLSNINPLAGTGFFNGSPIMTGNNATLTGPSTFTVFTNVAPSTFDSGPGTPAGAAYWAGVTPNSVTGTGSTQINFDVTSADSTYFNVPAGSVVSINLFNPQLGVPFSSEDPNKTFNNGAIVVGNQLGTVNGGTVAQGGGALFEAESQGKGAFSVTAVPEPTSMLLLVVGGLGATLVSRRRKS